jgi:ABC-2 type transport system permease protein
MSLERAPGLIASTSRLFALEWPALLWGRRGRWMLPLLAWPVIGPAMRLATGARLPWTEVVGPYVDYLLPLVALFHATRLVRQRAEDQTLVYLLARPVSRAAVLLGAFGAYLAAALTIAAPALVVGFFLSSPGGGLEGLARALLATVAALAAFGAVFAMLGLVMRKPLVFGLILLFSWLVLAGLPGAFPRLTLVAPLRAVAGLPSAPVAMSASGAALALAVFAIVMLLAAIVFFRRGEYGPEG